MPVEPFSCSDICQWWYLTSIPYASRVIWLDTTTGKCHNRQISLLAYFIYAKYHHWKQMKHLKKMTLQANEPTHKWYWCKISPLENITTGKWPYWHMVSLPDITTSKFHNRQMSLLAYLIYAKCHHWQMSQLLKITYAFIDCNHSAVCMHAHKKVHVWKERKRCMCNNGFILSWIIAHAERWHPKI